MNTTYPDHLAYALSFIRKQEADDMWYIDREVKYHLMDQWNRLGLSHEDQDRLLDAVYDELERRNEVQREVDATEWEV